LAVVAFQKKFHERPDFVLPGGVRRAVRSRRKGQVPSFGLEIATVQIIFLFAEFRAPERFRFFLSTGPGFPVAHGKRAAIRGDVPELVGFPVLVSEMLLQGEMVMA
jgi:hypothetical protein